MSIEAIGTNDGDDYAKIAEDLGGSPGTFGTADVALGTIAPLATVAFWTEAVLPSGLTADNNPRRYRLDATGLTT